MTVGHRNSRFTRAGRKHTIQRTRRISCGAEEALHGGHRFTLLLKEDVNRLAKCTFGFVGPNSVLREGLSVDVLKGLKAEALPHDPQIDAFEDDGPGLHRDCPDPD